MPHAPDRPPRRRRTVTCLLLVVAVLAAVTSLAELIEVPGLSYVLMLGTWGIDWLVLLAVLTLVVLVVRRRHRDRAVSLAALLLVLSLVVTAGTGWRQVDFARSQGVRLDLWALTGIGQGGASPDLQPVVLDDTDTGQLLQAGVWLPRDRDGSLLSLGQPRQGAGSGDAAGVVVLLHGGGWSNGNRLNPMTRGQAAWLASQGYLAIALDYPLSTPGLATWQLAQSRVTCGLAWVASHAARYGGDAQHLALVGDSAGGNLALETTYRQALGLLDPLEEACGDQVPDVDAVSTTYPIADPVGFHNNPDLVMAPFVSERARRYTGGTPEQVPERYEAIDPRRKLEALAARGLAPDLPPTLIVHGERDHVVPVKGTRSLEASLSAAGAPHTTVIAPLTDHVFDLNPGSVVSQTWRTLTIELLSRAGVRAAGR
ncbi:alpha/beta hydrolase fold domain-containing protein [Actinomyces faecalis]|uniref:alpha/beta hydrolase fold domain-containing protein n=1 Tax=Actinomyces faecalis TaxID=2722820 RepID=UPI0015561EB5|nr:alpha/beta hydrolase fold domain-containing protein [Actinomyces faecalis]